MATKFKYKKTKHFRKLKLKNLQKTLLLGLMIFSTIYASNYFIQKVHEYKANATTGNAQIFIEPAEITLPQDLLVTVWASTDKSLGYAQVELNFDHTLLQLSQEIGYPNADLKRIIKSTTMAESNETGKISFVIAADPSTVQTAPSGTFQLATLKLSPKTIENNIQTKLTVETYIMQLVDMNAIPFETTGKNGDIIINPVATSTPTPSPIPTSTPTAIPTTPTLEDNSGPEIILELGKLRNRYWVTASVTDESGVSEIVMFTADKEVNTCFNSSTCTFNINKNKLPEVIYVTATDNSKNYNTSSEQILVVDE